MEKDGDLQGRHWIVTILLMITLIALPGCSKDTNTVELKLLHFWPSTHPAEKELVELWAAAIKEPPRAGNRNQLSQSNPLPSRWNL